MYCCILKIKALIKIFSDFFFSFKEVYSKYSFFSFFNFILFLNLKQCISFAKHQNESATGIHVQVFLTEFLKLQKKLIFNWILKMLGKKYEAWLVYYSCNS